MGLGGAGEFCGASLPSTGGSARMYLRFACGGVLYQERASRGDGYDVFAEDAAPTERLVRGGDLGQREDAAHHRAEREVGLCPASHRGRRGYWVTMRARSRMPAVVPTYMSRVMR